MEQIYRGTIIRPFFLTIKWCFILILFMMISFKSAAAKELTRFAEFRATVANENWCGNTVTVSIHAAAAESFSKKRENLKKVTSLVKIFLETECSSMKRIIFKGYANDTLVYSGEATDAGYWVLTEVSQEVSEETGEQESAEVLDLRRRYNQSNKRVLKPLTTQRKYASRYQSYRRPPSTGRVPAKKVKKSHSFPVFSGNPLKDRNYPQSALFYREDGVDVYFIKYKYRQVELVAVHDVGPNEPILDLVGSGYNTSYSKKMMDHFKNVTLAKVLERVPDAGSIIIKHYAKGVYLPDSLNTGKPKIEPPLIECYFTKKIPF